MHARAGLLDDTLALGERLVVQHERVAALLPKVPRERIPGPNRAEARVLFEPGLRDDSARIARAYLVHGAPNAVTSQATPIALIPA
jgi:hypothetical protein